MLARLKEQGGTMKRMNRRQFGKLAAGAALGVPLASVAARAARLTTGRLQESAEKAKAAPKLTMTKEQEEKVAKAIERRKEFLAGLHERPLPYSLEPAFVFRAQLSTQAAARRKGRAE
jgi:hypothetical protein